MSDLENQETPRLHEILYPEEIETLYNIFKKSKEQKFNRNVLRQVLRKFDITFTDDQYEKLFLKINLNRDDECDWNEFVSHLLLGFQVDDPFAQKATLNLPIEGIPVVRKAMHKYPIVRIRFCPTVLPDRSLNTVSGNYVTASKDGTVIYWSQNFEYKRMGKSKSPTLKVAKTWILDFICLPDVRVICTSSIERELRFYDTTASNFNLRIVITSLPFAVNCMDYWFGETTNVDCKIVLGDFAGNVYLMEFCAELRGPFQSKTGATLTRMTWKQFLADGLPLMKVSVFPKIHSDIVRQVSYCETLNAIISAAECRDIQIGRTPAPGLVISELGVQKNQTIMRMTKGVTCFDFDRVSQLFATGGPDCMLRIWNHIVPQKPVLILPGHHAGIVSVFLQDAAKKAYTIDKVKTIKVWDITDQNLMQTYISMANALTDRASIACMYFDKNREFIVASMKIATIKCCPLLRLDKCDGWTHARPVSVALYNDLFRSVITCGLDSYIIVWDPWTGKRLNLIKQAHTRIFHGEKIVVEITAGCFDPKKQLLLTGARDGSLKIWNFNNGMCVRHLSIEYMCEVTTIHWVPERILVGGWNKHIIEFSDTLENEHGNGKHWDTCHAEDILAGSARQPETLATGSYSGELILWKLETGQPYRRYDVANPTKRIKIVYDGQRASVKRANKYERSNLRNLKFLRKSFFGSTEALEIIRNKKQEETQKITDPRRVSIIQMPGRVENVALAVRSIIFLNSRPMHPEYGTMALALDHGLVQFYSHHNLGEFMKSFNAIHMAGDCVVTMTTDEENKYLITGTVLGYIKIWFIKNYCVPQDKRIHVNMPKLRLNFPFLINDRWEGRAKRTHQHQLNPFLISCYKGHTAAITSIIYLKHPTLLLSSSSDCTVRIWTLGGRYIGTLGSPVQWAVLSHEEPVPENFNFRIPPDIQRIASSTTLKVINGAYSKDPLTTIIEKRRKLNTPHQHTSKEQQAQMYGEELQEPILGKNVILPTTEPFQLIPQLDKSFRYYPVYNHLEYHKAEPIDMPNTPFLLTKCKNIDFVAQNHQENDTQSN